MIIAVVAPRCAPPFDAIVDCADRGSMLHIFFQAEPIDSMRDVRDHQRLAEKAFYLHALIEVFTAALEDVQAVGLFADRMDKGEASCGCG